jgi:hypothetical protein
VTSQQLWLSGQEIPSDRTLKSNRVIPQYLYTAIVFPMAAKHHQVCIKKFKEGRKKERGKEGLDRKEGRKEERK